jgi:steroid delta-isomerase-like uncharacterized protein
MSEENKRIARRVIEALWNQGKFELAQELIARDYVEHMPRDKTHGPEGVKQFLSEQRSGFPDLHYTVEDQVAEGDKVVTRWVARGTHQGEFKVRPATGKRGSVTGITICRIAGGKLIEAWTNPDEFGLMRQLEVTSSPAEKAV